MEVANPIYDVVFKYLMEDNEIAKLILSIVTKLQIIELDFLPQELSINKKSSSRKTINLSIYRLDFSAKIKEEDGAEKIIIIEVQKTRFAHENLRFRTYLGKQYMNKSYYFEVENKKKKIKYGLPILPIFFLGDGFPEYSTHSVILIKNVLSDAYTKEVIEKKSHFVNSLFHEGIIINIAALKDDKRDELEMLLSIFDQKNKTSNKHIMNLTETEFPVKIRPVINRLRTAVEDPTIRDMMQVEDDFIAEILDYEDTINKERKLKEEERKLKENAIQLKEEERKQKEEERKQKEDAIRLLSSLNVDKSDISIKLNIPIEEIESIISNKKST